MNRASRWSVVVVAAALSGTLAQAQTTERASVDSSGAEGNAYSSTVSISADGRLIAFHSSASNLVAGDTNNDFDVFVRDRQSGTTERVSVDSGGVQGNSSSLNASISADGRFVAFHSLASNLVAGDTNNDFDVFVRDRVSGTTERVSVDSNGAGGDLYSLSPSISSEGRFVAFQSYASNLVPGDTNGAFDIFVRDRLSGTTERVSVDSGGTQANAVSAVASITGDGRFVVFYSSASNLVAGDANGSFDVFVRDRLNGTTERVSIESSGVEGNSVSYYPAISAGGRFVVFGSLATNLVANDTNGYRDFFVRDRLNGTTENVSVATSGAQANFDSGYYASISADGRFVAFESVASNLVAGDTNGWTDIFVRDRLSATTERVSVATGGAEGHDGSYLPSISADGRLVAFESHAPNLVAGDTNGTADVFVRDRAGPPPPIPFCFGDGSAGNCPCGLNASPGAGCQNSLSTGPASGGAVLTATGNSSLANDTLALTSSGELPSVLSVFLQGDIAITGVYFGDGLRCVDGTLKRLYVKNAVGGVVTAPQPGDPSISTQSAALGDPIPTGAIRYYQTYYRDPELSFCPSPTGDSWNISNGMSAVWQP